MRMKREMRSLAKSFKNAFCGIYGVIKHERNFRIHICMMLYVILFSVIGQVEKTDVLRFVLCFGAVLAAELVNTSLELLCDAVSSGFDERIREIKDIAAGAVLVTAISSAVVGLITFLDPVVFGRIMKVFFEMPYVAAIVVLTLPFAVRFVVKRGK
ncbi:MAG: diacylglycerol kinase family protein [Oscillospiraceae bacterium]|nr:diacylglycerol kinase family protein [Oscillospiraceae bacterium]MBQ4545192.1 diacylglycerol kinase family protein [Oscillospiraceae bacterium]MBQ6902579.1 diacylglycerol kinase family protein [Oscillospiraceae bacterium]